ncbi:hypothetical protein CGLO_16379 [Colletotrichum gloeosporioides Cg-14]|uniref:Uncharacterized protein n=1 Tax=Colletotrichum gloeosporioides (strain Cg-14) TaxID=1237896 RepID=T0KZS4_COLGC|nr:hypothetical protein CGLO_16379 [Colletotrichum gloeosporioides Cg-14]
MGFSLEPLTQPLDRLDPAASIQFNVIENKLIALRHSVTKWEKILEEIGKQMQDMTVMTVATQALVDRIAKCADKSSDNPCAFRDDVNSELKDTRSTGDELEANMEVMNISSSISALNDESRSRNEQSILNNRFKPHLATLEALLDVRTGQEIRDFPLTAKDFWDLSDAQVENLIPALGVSVAEPKNLNPLRPGLAVKIAGTPLVFAM